MKINADIVTAATADGPMAILVKRPTTGTWPKILMFHDGPGIRAATHEFGAKLAATGYEVLIPDLYHRHGSMIGYELQEREADPSLVEHLWEMLSSLTDDGIQADMDTTLRHFAIPPTEAMGTIGFCVGARASFRTMIRFPQQFVVGAFWHPSYLVDNEPDSPHLSAAEVSVPLFIGLGGADQMQPVEGHRLFLDAIEPLEHVEVEVIDGADHGFSWPGWPSYHHEAATRCFERTTELFASCLQGAG